MNRAVAVCVVLFVCVLAISTSASIVTDDPDARDHLEDGVVAYPDPGPNGIYAFLEDGEIRIDLSSENPNAGVDGVPARAGTGLDDVFRLENEGTDPIVVWLGSEQDRIEYYTSDGPIDDPEDAVVLAENDSVGVGFTVDSTELDAGDEITDRFAVHTAPIDDTSDARTSIGNSDVSFPTSVRVSGDGEFRNVQIDSTPLGVAVDVDLAGLEIGEGLVLEQLSLATSTVTDVDFDVEAVDETRSPELATLPEDAGAVSVGSYVVSDVPDENEVRSLEYTFTVDRNVLEGREAEAVSLYRYGGDEWEAVETAVLEETDGTVTYVATLERFSTYAVGLDAPVFSVTDVRVEPSTPIAGEPVSTTVTVKNDGTVEGTFSESVAVEGQVVADLETTVEPGERGTETLEWVPSAAGTYELTVGEDTSTTVSVQEGSDSETVQALFPASGTTDGDANESAATVVDPTEERTAVTFVDVVLLTSVLAAAAVVISIVPWVRWPGLDA